MTDAPPDPRPASERLVQGLATISGPVVDPEGFLERRYRTHSIGAVALAAAGAIAFGWFLLWSAVESSGPLRGLLGASIVTIGLRTINGLSRYHLDGGSGPPTDGRSGGDWRSPTPTPTVLSIGGAAAAIGAMLIVVAAFVVSPVIAAIGLIFLGLSVGPFSLVLRRLCAERAEHWVVGGMAATLLGGALVALLPGGRVVGIVVILGGLLAYQLGLPAVAATAGMLADRDRRDAIWGRIVRVFPGDGIERPITAAAVAAAVLFVNNWWPAWVVVTWVGALVIVLSLIALGAGFRRRADEHRRDWSGWWTAVGVVGLVLIAVGLWQTWFSVASSYSLTTLLAVGALIALVGASLAWHGESLFFGVLIGLAVVFGLVDHTEPDSRAFSGPPAGDDAAPTDGIVAVGDSWISGEGTGTFFAGTDQVGGGEENGCHRGVDAYAVLVAEHYESELDFLACSGADIRHLIDLGGDLGGDAACRADDPTANGQQPCSPIDVYGRRLQLDVLRASRDTTPTQLVLVSVGGNDAGFGKIVQGCLLPASCAELRDIWLTGVQRLGPDLARTYTELRDLFGTDTPIVVMPYPLVVDEATCDRSPLDADDHAFVLEFATVLNERLAVSAAQAGVEFFEPGMFAFRGHRICDDTDEPALNLLDLQARGGDFVERINPRNWVNNSFHPTVKGHELTANALVEWIDERGLLDSTYRAPDPQPDEQLVVLGVQSLAPFPADVRGLFAGERDVPDECRPEPIDGFATRSLVFNDPAQGFDDDDRHPTDDDDLEALLPTLWWPVVISGAERADVVCYTDQGGDWILGATGGPDGTLQPTGDLSADAGQLRLRARLPDAATDPNDEPTTPAERVQWVLFRDPTAMTDAPDWQLRAIQFCTTVDDCAVNSEDWSRDRIHDALNEVAAPFGALLLGGWFFALGWVLAIRPRLLRAFAG